MKNIYILKKENWISEYPICQYSNRVRYELSDFQKIR